MNDIYVHGIGLTAAGMSTWLEGASILRGDKYYEKSELPAFTPHLLRPNERRRTTALIKLALQVAEQAMEHCALSAQNLCSVFSSSEGDIAIVDKICDALTLADRPVSPTHFHNSVHNAPAGYWAIATGSQLPSVSMSAGPGSYAGGLLEAAGFSTVEQLPTLLVSYDLSAPENLKPLIPILEAFGSAMIVGSDAGENSLAKLHLALNPAEETTLNDHALETLRLSNPAARALPLFKAIACKQAQTVVLPYLEGQNLSVTCTPC
ncbi:beta-ketoacyl synthase chain length factor [Kaarinaea lacus]